MIKGLLDEIASLGARGSIVPFSRMNDLKKDMLEVKNAGYHTDWLDRMVNHMTGDMGKFAPTAFRPRSLISVIIPSPKVILQFHYHGKPVYCIVPPHYTTWESKNNQVLQTICGYLAPHGFSAAMLKTISQKLLAVHCGLAQYGRNICYNDEFGSYMQIMTFVSDLPCDDETTWFPLRRMNQCDTCSACINACPTGAIDVGRRYIDADRCVTLTTSCPPGPFRHGSTKKRTIALSGAQDARIAAQPTHKILAM